MRGVRLDEFKESEHPRDENGKFVSGGGSGSGGTDSKKPELTSVGTLPSAKEIGFKPKTESTYRNRRDELVARHKALREKNGEPGMPDCTVDPDTGDMVTFRDGFQVAFQTSVSEEDGDGHVSDEDYDRITEELKKRTGSKAYVGVFDVPETSFHCRTYAQAMAIARRYNQHSILKWSALNKYRDVEWTEEITKKIFIENPDYDPSKNHVKGN